MCEFERGDTKGPDVGFMVVARLLDNFRGHPEGSSDKRVLLRHCRRELARDAKIGQFDLTIGADKDVRRWKLVSAQVLILTCPIYP